MEAAWAAPGVTCMCVHEGPWLTYYELAPGFIMQGDTRPGPKFMEQCVIDDVRYLTDQPGHNAKLVIKGYPTEDHFCSCQFRPLEKLEDEVTKEVTAPVTPELVRA